MKLFAHQPAPVQISYLGYPCTTGVETIQYRLTDALSDPVGMTEDHYAEELIRLPRTAWCYRPPADAPDVSDLPSITRGYITFGSFNSFSKVNERVIETWANILLQMPNSRLYLKTNGLGDASVQRRVADAFAAHGVDESRLTMRGKDITIPEHLSRYHEIDIALDTFPYNGTTTTCEALSMGVPVVTIAGDRHMSRVGVSLLNSVGLTELIAEDLQTYVQIAVNLAADIDRLRSLRHDLRERMNRSPLRDEAGFTGEFDESIRQLWRRWCAHPPI